LFKIDNQSPLEITTRPTSESNKRKPDDVLRVIVKRGKPDSPAVTRHHMYWSSDQMVIVEVHSTLFKLHERHLAWHSPFFARLFAGRHPEQARYQTHIDGETVYSVSVTSVEDFETLLSAIDDNMYVDPIS
jgi:hypothetical protein